MHQVLLLGAGLVPGPMVRYLLGQPDFRVTVASRTVSKAEALVGDHPQGQAVALNVRDDAAPFEHHPICRLGLLNGVHERRAVRQLHPILLYHFSSRKGLSILSLFGPQRRSPRPIIHRWAG